MLAWVAYLLYVCSGLLFGWFCCLLLVWLFVVRVCWCLSVCWFFGWLAVGDCGLLVIASARGCCFVGVLDCCSVGVFLVVVSLRCLWVVTFGFAVLLFGFCYAWLLGLSDLVIVGLCGGYLG